MPLALDGKPVTVRLDRGLVLEGQVVDDANDMPIVGAEMYAMPVDFQPGDFGCEAEGLTDEQGMFRFSNLDDREYRIGDPQRTATDTVARTNVHARRKVHYSAIQGARGLAAEAVAECVTLPARSTGPLQSCSLVPASAGFPGGELPPEGGTTNDGPPEGGTYERQTLQLSWQALRNSGRGLATLIG